MLKMDGLNSKCSCVCLDGVFQTHWSNGAKKFGAWILIRSMSCINKNRPIPIPYAPCMEYLPTFGLNLWDQYRSIFFFLIRGAFWEWIVDTIPEDR